MLWKTSESTRTTAALLTLTMAKHHTNNTVNILLLLIDTCKFSARKISTLMTECYYYYYYYRYYTITVPQFKSLESTQQ